MTVLMNNYFNKVTVQNGYFSQDVTVGFRGPQGAPGSTMPRFSNLKLAGHSYTDIGFPQQDQQNPYSVFYNYDDYFGYRVKEVFGISRANFHNLGVSGNTARDGYLYTLQHENPQRSWPWWPDTGCAIIMFGGNDQISGTSSVVLDSFREGLKSMIARYIAAKVYDHNNLDAAGKFVLDSSANWDEILYDQTTQWTPAKHGSGIGYWSTNTAGAYLTFQTPSDFDTGYIHIGFIAGANGGTANIYVDGVLKQTETTYNLYPSTAYSATGRTHKIARVAVSSGTHTIKVECASVTANGFLQVNYWQIEAAHKPVVLVSDFIQPSNPTSIWIGMQDPNVAKTYNEYIKSAVSFWGEESIVVVDANTAVDGDYNTWYTNKNSQYFNGDGLHPNPWGATRIANAFFKAATKIISNGGDGSKFNWPWSFEQDPLYKNTNPANRIWSGTGKPFIIDTFNQGFSQNGLGGSWSELGGVWGRSSDVNYGEKQFLNAVVRSAYALPYSIGVGAASFIDNFNRADSTSTLGSPWTTVAGTVGIKNNKAYCVTASPAIATIETSLTNHYAEFITTNAGIGDGIIVKYVDSSNYMKLVYTVLGWVLYSVVAGSPTALSGGASTSVPLRVECTGANAYIILSSGKDGPYTIPGACAAGTKVGIIGATTSAQWDNFRWGAYAAGSDSAGELAVIDTGWSDGYLSIECGPYMDNSSGFAFRVQDNKNYYAMLYVPAFGAIQFAKVVAGVTTLLGVAQLGEIGLGQTHALLMNGSNFTLYAVTDDTHELSSTLITLTDTTFPTGTKHGMLMARGTGSAKGGFSAFGYGQTYLYPRKNDMYIDVASGKMYGPYDPATPSWPVSSTSIGGGSGSSIVTSVDGYTGAVTGMLYYANNLSDVQSAATSRTNLGLGSLATKNSIANADVTAGAGIAYSKLALTGSVVNADFASMAANTVKANATNGSATPTDVALTAGTMLARTTAGNIAAVHLPKIGRPKTGSTRHIHVPGMSLTAITTFALTANNRYYFPFDVIGEPIVIDTLNFEVTANVASSNARVGFMARDEDWQPTGSVLADSGSISTATNGVKTYTPGSPVTLQPGEYLAILHVDAAITVRAYVGSTLLGSVTSAMGTNSILYHLRKSLAYGAIDSTAWDTYAFFSSGIWHPVLFGISDPTG